MKNLMIAFTLLFASLAQAVEKEPRQLARKLYISLTGVTPTSEELNLLQVKVVDGKAESAAYDIINQTNGITNGGAFYSVTVKDMVTPWTNKAKTTLAPLNDMSATIIGWIRDDKKFNEILYTDSVYKASGVTFKSGLVYLTKLEAVTNPYCIKDITTTADKNSDSNRIVYVNPLNPNDPTDKKCRLTKYPKSQLDTFNAIDALYVPHMDIIIDTNLINTSNDHYESISAFGLDLGDKSLLVHTSQEVKLHLNPKAISGLLSTRSYGAAYLYAGTNRAPVAFAMEHFLCKDMEELNDTTIPDLRNRRDVDRSPGGTSQLYKNRCIGCHAGMDALSGAFAYYDYVGSKVVYRPGEVAKKMNHNVVFPEGFVTQSDNWINLWLEGQNAALKWDPTPGGEGVKSLGVMLSKTEAFHSCMAKQVYEKVCFKKAISSQDKARIVKLTEAYKSKYNMKTLFAKASVECMGD